MQLNLTLASTPSLFRLLVCRPLAQRVMSIRPVPGQGEVDPFQQAQQQQFQTPQQQQQAPAWAAPVPSGQQQQPQHQQRRLQPAMGSWAASALPAAVAQAAGQRSQPPPQQQQQPRVDEGAGEQQAHPLTVPVSAVAAGLAPDRSGTAPTGSGELAPAWRWLAQPVMVYPLQVWGTALQALEAHYCHTSA